jgi:hypothetical protein
MRLDWSCSHLRGTGGGKTADFTGTNATRQSRKTKEKFKIRTLGWGKTARMRHSTHNFTCGETEVKGLWGSELAALMGGEQAGRAEVATGWMATFTG